MITIISTSIIISTTIFIIITNTPISTGLTILTIATATTFLFATLNSSWIAFLIFLIYISGTLIIFTYFVAIAPNKIILPNTKIPIIIYTPPLITIICLNFNLHTNLNIFNRQTNTFYRKISTPTLIILALTLLITIIIIVKISSSTKGPLRSFQAYV